MRSTLVLLLLVAGCGASGSPTPPDAPDGGLSCPYAAGALASATLGLSEADRQALPLKHLIIMMKENRSFDHLFGGLRTSRPEVELFPDGFTNADRAGVAVAPFHLDTTCLGNDPDHQWTAMHNQIDNGLMDGYVRSAALTTGSDGHFALGYYDQHDLPFYYFLADTYALADHYFPSVRSGTFPNRDYLYLGTSGAVRSTQFDIWPDVTLPSIFDELDAAGVSWGVYGDDHPLEETLNNPRKNWEKLHPWGPVQKLIDAFASDTVPSVVFVDGTENERDEHPTADVQLGEAWTKSLYDAATASPAWNSTAILLTYDEAGGFFDHVVPPDACLARPEDSPVFERGTRVPLMVLSPWARPHYVSKVTHDHTSMTRLIEAVFGLPALTARDANSDALLDMFDFKSPPAPIATAPAAGTGGCQGPRLTLSKTSYASGEPIVLTFANGPGHYKDWLGIYPRTTLSPMARPDNWAYVSGTQGASAALTQGTVSLDASTGAWPLAAGSYTAYYFADDVFETLGSIEFDVR